MTGQYAAADGCLRFQGSEQRQCVFFSGLANELLVHDRHPHDRGSQVADEHRVRNRSSRNLGKYVRSRMNVRHVECDDKRGCCGDGRNDEEGDRLHAEKISAEPVARIFFMQELVLGVAPQFFQAVRCRAVSVISLAHISSLLCLCRQQQPGAESLKFRVIAGFYRGFDGAAR